MKKVHNNAVGLFKVITTDELPEDLGANKLDALLALTVNSLLFQSQMENEMNLIH